VPPAQHTPGERPPDLLPPGLAPGPLVELEMRHGGPPQYGYLVGFKDETLTLAMLDGLRRVEPAAMVAQLRFVNELPRPKNPPLAGNGGGPREDWRGDPDGQRRQPPPGEGGDERPYRERTGDGPLRPVEKFFQRMQELVDKDRRGETNDREREELQSLRERIRDPRDPRDLRDQRGPGLGGPGGMGPGGETLFNRQQRHQRMESADKAAQDALTAGKLEEYISAQREKLLKTTNSGDAREAIIFLAMAYSRRDGNDLRTITEALRKDVEKLPDAPLRRELTDHPFDFAEAMRRFRSEKELRRDPAPKP
jgi:hypothetical protein